MKLQISLQSPVAIFKVGGKVGWESSRFLDRQVRHALNGGSRFLVFDLDAIDFLSSGAIGVLVYNLRRLAKVDGDIFVVTCNDYVQYLFQMIGYDRIFEGKTFVNFEEFAEKAMTPRGIRFQMPESDSFHEIPSHHAEDEYDDEDLPPGDGSHRSEP